MKASISIDVCQSYAFSRTQNSRCSCLVGKLVGRLVGIASNFLCYCPSEFSTTGVLFGGLGNKLNKQQGMDKCHLYMRTRNSTRGLVHLSPLS